LAAEIRRAYPNADVKLIASSGGRFEVTLDGTAIFEKSKLHRHAKPGEVVRLIAAQS
jgi:selT/selW/selH-like putative selenoprotein